jgi:hypothetical protein
MLMHMGSGTNCGAVSSGACNCHAADRYDEYGNVGRTLSLVRDDHDTTRWALDQPAVLTDAECDRALVHLEGHEPERLGRRLSGDEDSAISWIVLVPPSSAEAMDAARSGERARATPRPG